MPSTCSDTSPPSTEVAISISVSDKRITCRTSSTKSPTTSPQSDCTSRIRARRVGGVSGTCSLRLKSKTVTSRPRTLHTPITSAGARGTGVSGGGLRISRIRVSSRPYSSSASKTAKNSRTGPFADTARRATPTAGRLTRSAMGDVRLLQHFAAREHLFDQGGRVEHQPDPLISQLGRSGEAAHAAQRAPERFDHDVLLSEQVVHHQPQAASAERSHHDEAA